jgi:equilibrative nucleoside transporter 1/2/3
MSGQAVGGIVASGCNVIFLAMGASETNAACFCFAFAVVFLGTALAAYLAVTKTFFFKHYLGESQLTTIVDLDKTEVVVGEKGDAEEVRELMLEEKERLQMEEKTKHVSILAVARKVSVYALSVFLVLFGTLACFPAVTVLVVPTDIASGSDWTTKYFIPVACFLLFNIGDYVGRTLAEFLRWPAPGRFGMWFMLLLSAVRLVFIPLFMLCNAIPEQRAHLPILIESDYAYMVLMVLFSVSNGYICSVGMMSAPQICKPEEQQSSTNVMLAALGFGLLTGAFLSNFFVKLI